ncbi:hypothetical protein [Dyadobacter sp. 676]|uniref:Uncharacterized protein n=1 Tax=Dyadobacter sp. 676 TaxID=3088362 RepID=A0AAU8FTW5_9BACT
MYIGKLCKKAMVEGSGKEILREITGHLQSRHIEMLDALLTHATEGIVIVDR